MPRAPRLTEAHVRLVHREVPDSGVWPGLRQFTEADYDVHLSDFLQGRPPGEIGLFAYGSLIWKPTFAPAAEHRATARGWQRSFSLRQIRFRGTPEFPGLMMQLDRGGACAGVLQMIPPEHEAQILADTWRREMTVLPPSYIPRWIEVEVAGEDAPRPAIAFTANPDSPNYAGGLSPEDVAACLSQSCGHWGTGADYVLQTVIALEAAGFSDPYLWDLQERIARLIEARHPEAFASEVTAP